jgi:hypothetical protein
LHGLAFTSGSDSVMDFAGPIISGANVIRHT